MNQFNNTLTKWFIPATHTDLKQRECRICTCDFHKMLRNKESANGFQIFNKISQMQRVKIYKWIPSISRQISHDPENGLAKFYDYLFEIIRCSSSNFTLHRDSQTKEILINLLLMLEWVSHGKMSKRLWCYVWESMYHIYLVMDQGITFRRIWWITAEYGSFWCLAFCQILNSLQISTKLFSKVFNSSEVNFENLKLCLLRQR